MKLRKRLLRIRCNRAPLVTTPIQNSSAPENISPFCPSCELLIAELKKDLCRLGADNLINKNIVTVLINRHGMRGI